jgi:hypothetical protein
VPSLEFGLSGSAENILIFSSTNTKECEMADIAMCTQCQCPNASTCYRRTAEKNPFQQAYADWHWSLIGRDIECDGYWPVKEDK